MTERKSTITREDVERILDRAMLDQPELRKRLRRVFGPLPPNEDRSTPVAIGCRNDLCQVNRPCEES